MRSVLFLTYHFPPEVGGIQTRIVGYLTELSRRGIFSTVIIINPSDLAWRGRRGGDMPVSVPAKTVELVRFKGGTRGLIPAATRILASLSSGKAEVVHVFTGAATFLGVFTLVAGHLFGRTTSMSIFGREDVSKNTRLGSALFIIAGTIADSISTNSASTAMLLSPNMRKKSHVLLGGHFSQPSNLHLDSDLKTVLFVGRLVKRKGLDDLLAAFKAAKVEVPDASLVIVGDGPELETLVEAADKLGLSDSVQFKGPLFGEFLDAEYERCAVCVLPSKSVPEDPATEGLGLALIEASMHGKPLIGTDHGGISEIIRNGYNGFIVPQGNPKKLGEVMELLLKDGDLARKMGENSLNLAKARFTLEAATDRLIESYAK